MSSFFCFGYVYTVIPDIKQLFEHGTASSLMQLTTLYLTPIISTLGVPLSLRYLPVHCPTLVTKNNLGKPSMPMFFGLTLICHLLSCGTFLFSNSARYESLFANTTLYLSIAYLYISLLTSVFIIGIATATFNDIVEHKLVVMVNTSTLEAGYEILEEFRAVKALLAPILFLTVVPQAMVSVSFSYQVVKHKPSEKAVSSKLIYI